MIPHTAALRPLISRISTNFLSLKILVLTTGGAQSQRHFTTCHSASTTTTTTTPSSPPSPLYFQQGLIIFIASTFTYCPFLVPKNPRGPPNERNCERLNAKNLKWNKTPTWKRLAGTKFAKLQKGRIKNKTWQGGGGGSEPNTSQFLSSYWRSVVNHVAKREVWCACVRSSCVSDFVAFLEAFAETDAPAL